jgi:predicted SAM-dependent methyltransferase
MGIERVARQAAKKVCDVTGVPRYFVRQNLFELRMMAVRLYSLTPFRRRRVRRLEARGSLQLMFGCGLTRYPGWVGIDCFPGKSVDLLLDLRRRLPFRDASVQYCYSEHFLEHLYPEEAEFHLKEVWRVLKPGGVYRVVVPAGIYFAKKYLEGDREFFALAHPWEERPIDALYKIVNWNGQHRSLYDFAQLEYLSRRAGFGEARECQVNQSAIPALRIDRSEPQRVAESLYVEVVKA